MSSRPETGARRRKRTAGGAPKPKRNAPKRIAAKGNAPKRIASKGTAPKRIASKGNAPKRIAAKGNAPKRIAAKGNAPKRTADKGNAPERIAPERIAPERIAPERIAKVLARAGLASRREAERWIAAGRVVVDGKVLTSPAVNVTAESTILVDGKPLPEAGETRLWRYHKPSGLVTSHRDPQGRPTVFEKLPRDLPRVVSVGRLDLNSEGLLLLTNDGGLARTLELPATGWTRRYRVRIYGALEEKALKRLADGVTVGGVRYGAIRAVIDSRRGTNAWLTVSLEEGRNREVRRVLEHLGVRVSRLIRVAYGPFQLGNLGRGEVRQVPAKVLREQMRNSANEGKGTGRARKRKP